MTIQKNGVKVLINKLDIVLNDEFKVQDHGVGTDFLVMEIDSDLRPGEKIELSLWVYGRGLATDTPGEDLEIQLSRKDDSGIIDVIDSEGFEVADYSHLSSEQLLQEMIGKLTKRSV